jgi:DNA modification methylase
MIVKEERIGGQRLLLGDCLAVMPLLGKVDAVVTSPPYGSQRDYGAKITDWRALVSGALTLSSQNAQVLCNLGLIHREGSVVPYWDDLIADMQAVGFRLFGWYVWDQGAGLPGDWQGRLAPSHEFIFHFNQKPRKPNKITPCIHGGRSRGTKSGLRAADGNIAKWSASDLTTQDFRIPDSVVRVTRHKHVGGIEAGHPAIFPVALPYELASAFTSPGETILDPFMGSGTTLVACQKMGRAGIGIEIDPDYFAIACKRVDEAARQPDMFVEAAPRPVQEGLPL